jgi:glutamate--cysteine ligase catalytic subunit
MADGCGRISEFSKAYRQRAHENQRIGMTPQSIPRLEDIDEMIKQGERIQMSLQRMRDVVFNHHQASVAEPPREAHYRRINGYDHETTSNYSDDMKGIGGFAGGDNKTRKRGVSFSGPLITDSVILISI